MRKIFFDLETTDLRPGQICQLAYITEENNKIDVGNWFFTVRYVTPTAFRIHGLNRKDLEKLSNGDEFADYAIEIEELFSGAKRIAHNVNFDRTFLQTELRRCNLSIHKGQWYCTMHNFTKVCKLPHSQKNGYKYPSLLELMNFFNITKEQVQKKAIELFDTSLGAHDARYDTVAVWLCYKQAEEKGLI